MLKIARIPLNLLIIMNLTGCASVLPTFDLPRREDGSPTVFSIVNKITCELQEIVDEKESDLRPSITDEYDIQVAVELSLTVTNGGVIAPSISIIDGPLTVASGFRFEQSRGQNFTEQLFFSLREMRTILNGWKKKGKFDDMRKRCYGQPDSNLSGVIGIKENFDLAITSEPFLNWSSSGNTGVFGGSVEFIVSKELTATGPTWTLKNFIGPGSLLSASNKHNNKLTFAFIRGPNAGKGVDERLKIQAQSFISDIRQNQIANSLSTIAVNSR
jgi:hypothetical protein